jgi:hypothetical protein
VWEYINPHSFSLGDNFRMNMVYRAYRVPYEWVPQAGKPQETDVIPPDVSTYRVSGCRSSGLAENECGKVTEVAGINPNKKTLVGIPDPAENKNASADFCVVRAEKK